MKLPKEFYKLPLIFDVERLQSEVTQFDERHWVPHHEGFVGNFALPLISVNGTNNNLFKGTMTPTEALVKSPYINQVINSFDCVFGRSRLMRLDPGAQVPLHFDVNYHWYNRVRLHIPIKTDPDVLFYCGDKNVHMAEGESWIFDSWKNHKVVNNSKTTRIHLVIDTVGSSRFWNMVNSSHSITKKIPYDKNQSIKLKLENYNAPVVMSTNEISFMINEFITELKKNKSNKENLIIEVEKRLKNFSLDWNQLWALYGTNEIGWDKYHRLRDITFHQNKEICNSLKLSNNENALLMLLHCIIDPALSPEVKKFI